jgi:hypothetical protein
MAPIDHISNGESLLSVREKLNSAIDSVNDYSPSAGGSGIVIPTPKIIIRYNIIYISCDFPDDAEFLNYNPRVFLYRRVKHNSYDNTQQNEYPNRPQLMVRDHEKGFFHPVHNQINQFSGGKMITEFPFANYGNFTGNDAPTEVVRYHNTCIFQLCYKSTGIGNWIPFSALTYIMSFGTDTLNSIRLSRCSRKYLELDKTTAGQISVIIGFAIKTDVGSSAISRVRFFSKNVKNSLNVINSYKGFTAL